MSDSSNETVDYRIMIALNWSERDIQPVQPSVLIALCVYMSTVAVIAVTANAIFIAATFKSKVSMNM